LTVPACVPLWLRLTCPVTSPLDLLLSLQALIGFMHQLGRLQGAHAQEAAQLIAGKLAQHGVQRGH
jgi:hypothetical protein